MSKLFWLSDDQWAAVEPHLPKNQAGARRVDDRRVILGIFHVREAVHTITSRFFVRHRGNSSLAC